MQKLNEYVKIRGLAFSATGRARAAGANRFSIPETRAKPLKRRSSAMKTFLRAIIFLALVAVALPASAHVQLSTPLKSRYKLRSVSCAACHVKEEKEKSKDHLTAFGKDIAKIVEGKMISERIADAKEAGSDERKKVLEQIKKEYEKALEKFDKMKAVNGKTYEEALPAGDIEGVKPR